MGLNWKEWKRALTMDKSNNALVIFIFILTISVFFCFVLSPAALASGNSSSADWPMFHHDLTHTGYSTSTPTATSAVQLWNYTTRRPVGSSPAIVNGYVYVGSDDRNIYCLNALTGTKIWNYTTQGPIDSSPAVANGYVYVGSDDHNIYCLNASTGVKVWNFTTGNTVESSPAVANGYVYVGSWDGNVYCLDALTGAKVWNYSTGGLVESSPAVAGGLRLCGVHRQQRLLS